MLKANQNFLKVAQLVDEMGAVIFITDEQCVENVDATAP
jgi:hypothetical protein